MNSYSRFLVFYRSRRSKAENREDGKNRTPTAASSCHQDGFSRVNISFMHK